MKKKILSITAVVGSLLGLFTLSSCEKSEFFKAGEYFFLRSEGADMPVWVRGNQASKVFILVLHGGPGARASEYIGLPSFSTLENEYAVVYWDQRASGNSQGNAKPESLTSEQFVQDLDKLVELIRHKYNQPTLFLMGHSWGGTLGSLYLLNAQQQKKIRGWIHVDGLHNNGLGYQLSRDFVMTYAQKQIDAGKEVKKWEEIIQWYIEHPTSEIGDDSEHPQYVAEANGYYYKGNPIQGTLGIFNSPRAGLAELYNSRYVARHLKGIIGGLELSNQMQAITLPTLVLWGKHDGILPVPLAQDYYTKLGTPATQKSVVIFEESAHNPMAEEPTQFADEVIRFVESYK